MTDPSTHPGAAGISQMPARETFMEFIVLQRKTLGA